MIDIRYWKKMKKEFEEIEKEIEETFVCKGMDRIIII